MARRAPRGPLLLAHDEAIGSLVAGADEAGRGALAGPLVAAAVRLDLTALGPAERARLERLDDSKRLPARVREELYEVISEVAAAVALVVVGPVAIDRAGIQAANITGLGSALSLVGAGACGRLVDGFALGPAWPEHQRLVRGDATSAAIAAASVIAKTTRDRLMAEAERRHPGYGLGTHMGYPTAAHRQAILRLGPSPVHRRSFCRRILGD